MTRKGEKIMTLENLKETLINDELFEKIGFTYDYDSNLYIALNFGNIVVVESDGATTQYHCSELPNRKKEELLQEILSNDCIVYHTLMGKYDIGFSIYSTFGEWLSECGGADF